MPNIINNVFFSLPEKVNLGLQQGVDNLTDPTKNSGRNFQILPLNYEIVFLSESAIIKFMFSKKDTKIDKIFTVDLTFSR